MAKKKSPSRQKYEADRPVISIRVPAELKQRIADQLRTTGKTYTQWATELFQGQADHAREVEEAYQCGFQDCSKWLARPYLEDEEQFEAVFGGLLWLAENEEQIHQPAP